MPEQVTGWLEWPMRALEIAGATALVLGFVVVTVRWLVKARRTSFADAGEGYRESLGRVILAGLEILVAATILKTVAFEPTVESMGELAFMVAIRTVLRWTTVLEMTGRWPWRQSSRA